MLEALWPFLTESEQYLSGIVGYENSHRQEFSEFLQTNKAQVQAKWKGRTILRRFVAKGFTYTFGRLLGKHLH